MEYHIFGLDIWEKHVRRVRRKGLEMLEDASHAEEIRRCAVR